MRCQTLQPIKEWRPIDPHDRRPKWCLRVGRVINAPKRRDPSTTDEIRIINSIFTLLRRAETASARLNLGASTLRSATRDPDDPGGRNRRAPSVGAAVATLESRLQPDHGRLLRHLRAVLARRAPASPASSRTRAPSIRTCSAPAARRVIVVTERSIRRRRALPSVAPVLASRATEPDRSADFLGPHHSQGEHHDEVTPARDHARPRPCDRGERRRLPGAAPHCRWPHHHGGGRLRPRLVARPGRPLPSDVQRPRVPSWLSPRPGATPLLAELTPARRATPS
jgi:hypothetical protein